MPVSEKKKESNKRWDSANIKRTSLAMKKEAYADMVNHAQKKGESINGFINRAISETMERDSRE